jgi:phytoene dehydrogenase-like protein
MTPSILIIGGGIAGLSAGCYARMNGFPVTILEQHTVPGGLCTAWQRGAYRFDGCLHWLVGTKPDSGFHQVWDELGVLKDTRVIDHEEFTRAVAPDGKTLILYTDVDRLAQHLLELAPEDAALIREITAAIRKLQSFDSPVGVPMELMSPWQKLGLFWGMRGALGPLMQYSRITVKHLADRFTNPFVREALLACFNLPGMPAIGFLCTMAWLSAHNAGYLEGGSLPLARRVAQRFTDLGGEIRYGALVTKILRQATSKHTMKAVGVQLADGSELRADYVISASDIHATFFELLNNRYHSKYHEAFDYWPVFPPLIQVSLGVAYDFAGLSPTTSWMLDTPLVIAGTEQRRLSMHHYQYDPTMAPAGKTVATVLFPAIYGYWKTLAKVRERYMAEKEAIAQATIAALDTKLPGFAAAVEQMDIATPVTFERYTRNWQGSFEGWMPSLLTGFGSLPKTLLDLDHFYMIGQWVQPGGGLPPAAQHGRDVVYMICKQEGVGFRAEKA